MYKDCSQGLSIMREAANNALSTGCTVETQANRVAQDCLNNLFGGQGNSKRCCWYLNTFFLNMSIAKS